MKIINISPALKKGPNENHDPIYLFYQFFLHKNARRSKEIALCLRRNVENPHIEKIYLLNERIYSDSELGIHSDKIIQIDCKKRLKFADVFNYIRENQIHAYNVIINADIFCNSSIQNLKYTQMHVEKQAIALLRYEYVSDDKEPHLFGPRDDSQDAWIIHSQFIPNEKETKMFAFEFGKPGCDNKVIYLLNILGYQLFNDPFFIQIYHVHQSQERNYTQMDVIHKPWGIIVPANIDPYTVQPSLGIDLRTIAGLTNNLTQLRFEDNRVLHDYLVEKMNAGVPFIVPRIAGIENNYAVEGELMIKSRGISPEFSNYIQRTIGVLKNNAGIRISTQESIAKYSQMYMESFQSCDLYTAWEPHGDVYKYIAKSHDYIKNKYSNKRPIWAFALDIFHYINNIPWTLALANKRVLIISAFEESIQEKIPCRKDIYGIDLFPGCEILTIKPPQTHGAEESREFDKEIDAFFTRLDAIQTTYDVALVSAGGYGNLICSHIYKSGKSAIYVGGVLQMYFGILGNRWLKERPDILRMYLNSSWTRPKEVEKPKNHETVEGACYW